MGAEGKYDLKLAPGFDPEAHLASAASSASAIASLKQRAKSVTSTIGSSLTSAGMKVARTITTDTSSARGSVPSRYFSFFLSNF